MYRKPSLPIKDRHVLIELDMDKHNEYDIKHLLNHAYLNHKAPHEYDDLKRYIRDITLGKHNSVYIMNNGSPNPLSSAFILGSPYLAKAIPIGTLYYDYTYDFFGFSVTWVGTNLTNNPSNCNSSTPSISNNSPATSANLNVYGFNNGTAIAYGMLYLPMPFNQIPTSSYGPYLVVAPISLIQTATSTVFQQVYSKYAYAPYVSSQNPLTLTAYLFWENSTSTVFNESYVYFIIPFSATFPYSQPYAMALVPLFYSTGSFSFSTSTYYLSMWQWTYQ